MGRRWVAGCCGGVASGSRGVTHGSRMGRGWVAGCRGGVASASRGVAHGSRMGRGLSRRCRGGVAAVALVSFSVKPATVTKKPAGWGVLWPCQAVIPWQSTQAAPRPLCWMGSMALATSRGRRRPVRRAGACSGVTAGPAQPSRAALRISGCRSGRLTGTSIGCLGWLSALRGGPASCSVVQASSARRFRITDGLSVRRRTSPALRQRSSAQRSLAQRPTQEHTHTHTSAASCAL